MLVCLIKVASENDSSTILNIMNSFKGKTDKHQAVVILHNIRSVYNVGGIFRTCDGVGVDHIYLSGYSPTPIDRFGRHRQDFHKAALGAERSVLWTQVDDVLELIKQLQADGFTVVAVEQDDRSINYTEIPNKEKVAFIFGNEVDGVDQAVLDICDVIAEIPMRGEKESLNVMVSAGVVLYSVLKN